MTKRKARVEDAPAQPPAQPPAPLSDRGRSQLDRMKARNRERDERPAAKFLREADGDGVRVIITNADDQDAKLHGAAMMEALGTRSVPFLNDTLDNIMRVMSPTRNVSEQQYNAALAILAAVEPENELEATLASQMVVANDCAMRSMRLMVGSTHPEHHKMHGDLANKFLRTFTGQMEALAKLRRGGEQIVKHVHVYEGGQAVVAGTINQGGRGKRDGQSQAAIGVEGFSALSGANPARDGVPIPGDAERAVSYARRDESGGAEG